MNNFISTLLLILLMLCFVYIAVSEVDKELERREKTVWCRNYNTMGEKCND